MNAASFVCEAYTKKEQERKARKVRGKLIDFPGKSDMRGYASFNPMTCSELEQYYDHAEGIVFVVDGTNYDARECGESECFAGVTNRYLFSVLTNEQFVENPCPILIAVNKSDIPNCAENAKVFKDIENAVYVRPNVYEM